MNRKDFEIVARGLKAARPAHPMIGELERWEKIAVILATHISNAEGCSGFHCAKFLAQCGVRS